MTDGRRRLGADGEARAAAWYQAQGYEVLARNWRSREGEIDLILARGRTVVVCEVKARTTASFGVPAEAVTAAKQRKVRAVTLRWLDDAPFRPREIRFDVASILGDALEIIEGAI